MVQWCGWGLLAAVSSWLDSTRPQRQVDPIRSNCLEFEVDVIDQLHGWCEQAFHCQLLQHRGAILVRMAQFLPRSYTSREGFKSPLPWFNKNQPFICTGEYNRPIRPIEMIWFGPTVMLVFEGVLTGRSTQPMKMYHPKRKGSSSNHLFWGAISNLGGVFCFHHESPIRWLLVNMPWRTMKSLIQRRWPTRAARLHADVEMANWAMKKKNWLVGLYRGWNAT